MLRKRGRETRACAVAEKASVPRNALRHGLVAAGLTALDSTLWTGQSAGRSWLKQPVHEELGARDNDGSKRAGLSGRREREKKLLVCGS